MTEGGGGGIEMSSVARVERVHPLECERNTTRVVATLLATTTAGMNRSRLKSYL